MPPNVMLECNWASDRGLNSLLTLHECGKPFTTLGLIPMDNIVTVNNRVRLFDELQSSQALELNFYVRENVNYSVTGLTIISEIPIFEVFSGEEMEYVGTVGGYAVENVPEIVSYRVDLLLPFRVKTKATLKYKSPPGKRSLWIFGVGVMWDYLPEMASCMDMNQVVNLLSSGRRKPASDTDMTLVTKLCEIFNSSGGSLEYGKVSQSPRGVSDGNLRQESSSEICEGKGDVGTSEVEALSAQLNPSNNEEVAARVSDLTAEFDAFRDKVENTLHEHSQRLGLVCDAVLSRSRAIHTPAGDIEKLQSEFRKLESEFRVRMQAQDHKLDSILRILRREAYKGTVFHTDAMEMRKAFAPKEASSSGFMKNLFSSLTPHHPSKRGADLSQWFLCTKAPPIAPCPPHKYW
ncbi:unnamed protein product [Notodromas monacha]|uniref:Uncharacterized protein n=1 Tax=Notodromas monacha TaxID=399045 RepID=A0A7R9BJH0_9CRUS|nr:unnamed protein product [Notodromas monacha]CAG0916641.1 unnamed protein product [Notodromas monacha]